MLIRLLLLLLLVFLVVVAVPRGARAEHFLEASSKQRIAVATLMRSPVELPYWLDRYRDMGIVGFFIRLEDSPHWERYLRERDDVFLLEVGTSALDGSNYHTLMERQRDFVNSVLAKASRFDVDFVLHLDQDELLEGSLTAFEDVPADAMIVHLENAEAVYQNDPRDTTCFSAKRFARCARGEGCRSYANGKAGGRPVPGVAFAGPHNFGWNGDTTAHDIPFEALHVLHFDSCTLGSFVEKFFRIGRNADTARIPFASYPANIAAAQAAHDAYRSAALDEHA